MISTSSLVVWCGVEGSEHIWSLGISTSPGFRSGHHERQRKHMFFCILTNTPRKINMEHKQGGLEDDVPLQLGDF